MSCNISVRLFHRLRELAGARELVVAPDRCTVAGLIETLLVELPEAAEELLEQDGEVSGRYTIVVNQQVTPRDQWDEMVLSEGDEVALLTMITGG